MSRPFWFWLRIVGWIILLFWYVAFTMKAFTPFADNRLFLIIQGLIGIIATAFILVGYYDLEKEVGKNRDTAFK
jgi:hypothetical protein